MCFCAYDTPSQKKEAAADHIWSYSVELFLSKCDEIILWTTATIRQTHGDCNTALHDNFYFTVLLFYKTSCFMLFGLYFFKFKNRHKYETYVKIWVNNKAKYYPDHMRSLPHPWNRNIYSKPFTNYSIY